MPKILLKIVLVLLHWSIGLLVKIISPIFAWKYEGKKGNTPKLEDGLTLVQTEIVTTPALKLAHKIRLNEYTSEEVVQAFIARIKKINGCLNCVVAERYAAALEEARAIDRVLKSDNIPQQYSIENAPLLGIPFTAKEAFAVTGMPNTSGLIARKHILATSDADVISNLRKAGAIPLALTNCSELCMWMESNNLLYGRTNNAYHHGRTVGGSSGGEGCVLSAAGSVIGVGSDIGGSIRMPAFFNGIFGHKPTKEAFFVGIVNNRGQHPNAENEAQTFLSTGPMCRYACDLIPMFKAMANPEHLAQLNLDQKVDLHKVKVFYMEDDGGSLLISPVHDDVKAAVNKAVSHLEGTFHGVVAQKVAIKELMYSLPLWMMKMSASENTPFCTLMGDGTPVNPLKELLYWIAQQPRHTLPAIGLGLLEKFKPNKDFVETMYKTCDELRKNISELLGEDGVFIYPTHPLPAPYHNQPLSVLTNFAYTGVFNVLGFPITAVPMGLSREGVPVGIQVIGNMHKDHLCLAVAEELEHAFGGWIPPY